MKRILTITITGICLLAAAALTPAHAADATMVIGANKNSALNIKGATPEPVAIAVKEFSFGSENATTIGSATGGAGTGKAKLNNLVIKKMVDGASPKLFQALAMGSSYSDLTLTVRKPGATGAAFYTLRFTLVFVSKINVTGSGDEQPMEEITFAYGAMEQTVMVSDATGAPGKPVTGSWSQLTNTADVKPPAP